MDKKIYDRSGKQDAEIVERSGKIQLRNNNGNILAEIRQEGGKMKLYSNGSEIATYDGKHTRKYMGQSYEGNKLIEIMQTLIK